MIKKLFIFIDIFIISASFSLAFGQPLQVDEKLKFKIRWGVIPAGEVTLETDTSSQVEEVPAQHFIFTARTYPAIDIIYKFREEIDSYTDLEITHSILYKKKQSGRSKRDITVTFDWLRQLVQYSNFNEKNTPVDLLPGTLDPLAALYFIRKQILTDGRVIERPVTDGKKIVIGQVKNLGRRKIVLFDKTYDTFLLEPNMKDVKGVFEKSKNAKMHVWITADEKKIPVKFTSKVIIGSFVAELFEHQLGSGQNSQKEPGSHLEKLGNNKL